MKKALLMSLLAAATFAMSGCTRPEIAYVLDDYCNFQKSCGYPHVNTETQYHDYGSCDKFHRDLLENTANGKSTGCRGDVEQFFIDFMNAQMALGCNATLVETLNTDKTTQNQLDTMLTCMKNSNAGYTPAELGEIGMKVLGTLEISLLELNADVAEIIANVSK
ncbi:MAG: hypothetical protein IJU23_13395 [Proteobacteria bacterium]|nr:hypothetical protein [Pseudomonadota bacterium]